MRNFYLRLWLGFVHDVHVMKKVILRFNKTFMKFEIAKFSEIYSLKILMELAFFSKIGKIKKFQRIVILQKIYFTLKMWTCRGRSRFLKGH